MNTNIDINFLLTNVDSIAQNVLHRAFGESLDYNYPIDLEKIAKAFDVPIYKEKLDDNLAGCFMAEGGNSAIVVNKKDPESRQRFTIAHELGHFISYKLQEKEGTIYDERGALASIGRDPEEVFANKFAAEVLMPKDEFKKQMESESAKKDKIDYLTRHFKVSKQAIEIRAKSLYNGSY